MPSPPASSPSASLPRSPGPPPPSPSPRAVLLDAGNTLVFPDRRRIFGIYGEVGVPGDERRFHRAELFARHQLATRVEEGAAGTEPHLWREFFLTLFRRSGVPEAALERVGERVVEEHRQAHLWTRVEPGTVEALDLLLHRGYRLGVISNADGRMEAALEAAGLRGRFEFVLDSERVGAEKPDPAIFQEGLRRLDLSPPDVLYVGDLYPVDVVGARRAGLQALLLDPSGALAHPVDRIPSVRELPAHLRQRTRRASPGEAVGG
jgi:putative hydrolase of the HAD superfamily